MNQRESKFRVFDSNQKIWLNPGNSDISFTTATMKRPEEPFVPIENFLMKVSYKGHAQTWDINHFTGLLDKNGVEIYEGDVVRTGEEFGEVQFDEQQSAFIILFQPHNKKQKSGCANLGSTWPSPEKEVVGNIYENPELLL